MTGSKALALILLFALVFVVMMVAEGIAGTESLATFVTFVAEILMLVFPSSWQIELLLSAKPSVSTSVIVPNVLSADVFGNEDLATLVTFWMVSLIELPSSWQIKLLLPTNALFSFRGKTS